MLVQLLLLLLLGMLAWRRHAVVATVKLLPLLLHPQPCSTLTLLLSLLEHSVFPSF